MKKYFLVAFMLVSFQGRADSADQIKLLNHFRVFTQKSGALVPTPVSDRQDLSIEFAIPINDEPTIKKVYNRVFDNGDFKTQFEVYFFNQNSERYLSQQITLTLKNEIVVKCTSYFGTDQKMLVPGACAGSKDGSLYGVSVFRGLL